VTSGATFFMVNPPCPTEDNEVNEEGLPAKNANGREIEIAFCFRVFGVFRGLFPGFLASSFVFSCGSAVLRSLWLEPSVNRLGAGAFAFLLG